VQGRHPWQTSDALGAAAVQLGPQAIAWAVILNKQLGVSFGKIATLYHQRLGLTLTRGAIVRALHRTARTAAPTYEALCRTIRGSPMVAPDETGWRVNGRLHWLWAFATPDTTVYAIHAGRGFPEAAATLGA
jgi:transposase